MNGIIVGKVELDERHKAGCKNVAIQAIDEKARERNLIRSLFWSSRRPHPKKTLCSLGLFRFELMIVTHHYLLAQIGSASLEARTGEDDDAFGSF